MCWILTDLCCIDKTFAIACVVLTLSMFDPLDTYNTALMGRSNGVFIAERLLGETSLHYCKGALPFVLCVDLSRSPG